MTQEKKKTLTSSPKCFMAYSNTPDAASGCCSLLLMLQEVTKAQTSFKTLLNTLKKKLNKTLNKQQT